VIKAATIRITDSLGGQTTPIRRPVKSESMSPLLRVRDWDRLYENNRSRELGRTDWFPAPNNLSADSYVELVSHVDGAAHFGVWNALLMVASRAKPRGALVRDDGRTHDPESLARVTRLPQQLIQAAIERLVEIGILEISGNKRCKKSKLRSHPSAAKPQDTAPRSHEGAAEGKRTEHHQEWKRTGRKKTRTEPQRTEHAHEEWPIEHTDVVSDVGSFSSKKAPDDEHPEERFASPHDELKAIYQDKAGEPITIHLLDAIRLNLECTTVSMSDFVVEVKKHAQNEWRNPAGFLRDLSQRFRLRTRTADRPVTAAEAQARNYKCPNCHSRIPGEGIIPAADGKFVPCTCASPEYIAHQRERGIFAQEIAQ
jgi:hypothetical protein